jgi:predicted amidohydrolase YtcJ
LRARWRARAGIDESTPDPHAGAMGRGARGARGHLVELAISRVETLARGDRAVVVAEGWLSRLEAYQARLFAAGITGIVDAMVPPMFEALSMRSPSTRERARARKPPRAVAYG